MAVMNKVSYVAGMSSQFMFPSEQCSPGDPGAIAPPPAALVTIQPDKDGGYSGAGGGVTPTNPATRVVSVSVQDSGQVRSKGVSSHYSLRIENSALNLNFKLTGILSHWSVRTHFVDNFTLLYVSRARAPRPRPTL